jgi:hypothetical protein
MSYKKLALTFLVYMTCVSSIHSLMFYLPANSRKCLKEEIHKDILVKGDYELTDIAGHTTKLEVVDSKNHILYNKEGATKGKFAFTTDEYDVFQICFETRTAPELRGTENLIKEVKLNVRHGTEAKDYENVSFEKIDLCVKQIFILIAICLFSLNSWPRLKS